MSLLLLWQSASTSTSAGSTEGSYFLDEVCDYLVAGDIASSSGSGTGWYLSRGFMPDSTALADRMVAIIETGGDDFLPGVTLDRPSFQVLVRGPRMTELSSGYEEADTKATEIRDRFHFAVGVTLSDAYYPGIVATSEPAYVGEDMNQRPVFSCNYRAWREVP